MTKFKSRYEHKGKLSKSKEKLYRKLGFRYRNYKKNGKWYHKIMKK